MQAKCSPPLIERGTNRLVSRDQLVKTDTWPEANV